MDGSWPENLDTIRKMVVEELMNGQELANQLRFVLSKSDDAAGSVKNLLMKIMKSFSTSLSILNAKSSVISQTQADFQVGLPCLVARRSEDSQESCKSNTITAPTKKNRRGCYERRTSLRTWKRDTSTLINDGQAWRKYGQKAILNAKYPRHYFRCEYKNDQGCKATKQVQRIQMNPPLYRTIYFGHHTCKDLLRNPEMILECNTTTNPTEHTSSTFISFETSSLTNLKNVQHHPFFSSIKQECKEEKTSCDNVDHNQPSSSSSSDYFVPSDLMVAAGSPKQPLKVLSSTKDFDHEGLISGMMEYVGLDLDDLHVEC